MHHTLILVCQSFLEKLKMMQLLQENPKISGLGWVRTPLIKDPNNGLEDIK